MFEIIVYTKRNTISPLGVSLSLSLVSDTTFPGIGGEYESYTNLVVLLYCSCLNHPAKQNSINKGDGEFAPDLLLIDWLMHLLHSIWRQL